MGAEEEKAAAKLAIEEGVKAKIAMDIQDEKDMKRATGKNMIIYTCKALYPMVEGDDKYDQKPDDKKFNAVAVKYDRVVECGMLDNLVKLYPNAHLDETFASDFIFPGFVDPHLHLWLLHVAMAGEIVAPDDWVTPRESCPGARDQASYIARIRAIIAQRKQEAKDNPDANPAVTEKYIIWGWHSFWHGMFDKDQLDELFPDDAVLLFARSVHAVVFNTKFAKFFPGYTEEKEFDYLRESFKDDNVLMQDECWKTYMFQEDAFVKYVDKFLPLLMNPKLMPDAIKLSANMLVSGGLVSLVDQGLQLSGPPLTAFINAEGKFSDPAKRRPYDYYTVPEAYGAYGLLGEEKCFAAIEANQPSGHPLETTPEGTLMYLPKQLKLFTDGAAFAQMMRVTGGYVDGHQGVNMMRPPQFQHVFKHFWDKGFQIHVHCNGDIGLQNFIDTVRYNMQRNPRADHRCAAHHLCVMDDTQPMQMKQLGMLPSFNTSYILVIGEKYAERGMTEKMAHNMAAVGSCTSIGLKASFHCDAPVAPPNPLYLAQRAIDRKGMETGKVMAPDERISRYSAMQAITINAAFCVQLERDYGSIEPGKLASFAVLDEDYFKVDEPEIEKIYVVGTITGGNYNPNTVSKKAHTANWALLAKGAGSDENNKVKDALLNGTHDNGKKVDCCEVNQQMQAAASATSK